MKKIFRHIIDYGFLNTYFMANLITYGSDRSTIPGLRRLNAQEKTRWIVPVCKNNHWYYLLVDNLTKKIIQYDSLNQRQENYGRYIIPHLRNVQRWEVTYDTMQQQNNLYDCGIYMLADIREQVQHGCQFSGEPLRAQILRNLTEEDYTGSLLTNDNTIHSPTDRVILLDVPNTQTGQVDSVQAEQNDNHEAIE